jgi:hypothetical protein
LKLLLAVLLALGATALLQAARSHWSAEAPPWFRPLAWAGAPDDLRWAVALRSPLDFALDGWQPLDQKRLPDGETLPRYLEVTLERTRPAAEDDATPSRRLQQLLDRYRARREGRDGRAPSPAEPEEKSPTVQLHVQRLNSAQRALILLRKRHPGEPLQKLEGLPALAGRDPDTGHNWVEFLADRYLIACLGDRLPDEGVIDVASRFLASNREALLGERSAAPSKERRPVAKARRPSTRRQLEARGRARQSGGSTSRQARGTKTPRGGAAPTSLPGPEPGPRPGTLTQPASPVADATPVVAAPPVPTAAPPPPAVPRTIVAPTMASVPSSSPGKRNPAARAQYEMGRQFLAMERPEEALKAFAAALGLDPTLTEARGLIGEVEQRFGATPDALGLEIPAAVAAPPPEPEPETPVESAPALMAPAAAQLEPVTAPTVTVTTPAARAAPPETAVALTPETSLAAPLTPAAPAPAIPPSTLATATEIPAPATVTAPVALTPPAVEAPPVTTAPTSAGHPAGPGPSRSRRFPVLPLLMAGVFSCLMFFLLKRRLGA